MQVSWISIAAPNNSSSFHQHTIAEILPTASLRISNSRSQNLQKGQKRLKNEQTHQNPPTIYHTTLKNIKILIYSNLIRFLLQLPPTAKRSVFNKTVNFGHLW